MTLERVNKLLGTALTAADVADVFARLGFAYKEVDGVFEVQPPKERLDLAIAEATSAGSEAVEPLHLLIGVLRLGDVAIEHAVNSCGIDPVRLRRHLRGYARRTVRPSVFPDAPNKPDFPTARLNPGKTYKNKMILRFTAEPR